ncbi:MAG: hypothetical protein JWL72_1358 [Ilumatobacteraceae bacterium]|nr:hypothetical protein [Ilumatobacteraceae bacterium]
MVLRVSRNFRLIWTGQVVSVVGDGMQRIALLWWARQTGGNGRLTAVALATMLPAIIGSPFGGWLADRFDRRQLMLAADAARLLIVSVLAVMIIDHHSAAWLVCAMVGLAAIATAVFDPTYAATVPSLLEPEHRPAANGLNMANSAVGGLAGPLVGGLLIASFGVGTVLVVNAATFAWSAAFIARARVPRPAGAARQARDEHTTRSAIASVLRDRPLRRLVGLASALNMAVAPLPLLVVALAVDRFHTGSRGYGVLEVTVSAGVLVGALAVGRLSAAFAPARTVFVPMLALGICLALAGLLPFAGSAAVFAIGGIGIAVANTALLTTFQNSVAAEVQGRVFGVVSALGEGLRPAGLALAAPLLAIAGVRGSFVVVALCIVAATLVWGRPANAKVVRRIDAQVSQEGAMSAG